MRVTSGVPACSAMCNSVTDFVLCIIAGVHYPHAPAGAARVAVGGRVLPSGARGIGADQRNRLSRRLLTTTRTEDTAIAAPAILGFSSPSAASGMAAAL